MGTCREKDQAVVRGSLLHCDSGHARRTAGALWEEVCVCLAMGVCRAMVQWGWWMLAMCQIRAAREEELSLPRSILRPSLCFNGGEGVHNGWLVL